jgi:AraC-like DNA-binding protein
MDFNCDERPSDSPYVMRVWRSRSGDHDVPFVSMAEAHWGMVVTRYKGRLSMTVRGPETFATPAYGPGDAEFVGIMFKPGAFMPQIPPQTVMDRCDVDLPPATGRNFWLNGASWESFDFENADTFVDRLVRDGLMVHEPVVTDALNGCLSDMSLRSVQRRFLRATGMTYSTLMQIERARQAVMLLKQGTSILDTVFEAGYFDQPHLTRSLKRFIGYTPAQIIDKSRSKPLSFLYKTHPF